MIGCLILIKALRTLLNYTVKVLHAISRWTVFIKVHLQGFTCNIKVFVQDINHGVFASSYVQYQSEHATFHTTANLFVQKNDDLTLVRMKEEADHNLTITGKWWIKVQIHSAQRLFDKVRYDINSPLFRL